MPLAGSEERRRVRRDLWADSRVHGNRSVETAEESAPPARLRFRPVHYFKETGQDFVWGRRG